MMDTIPKDKIFYGRSEDLIQTLPDNCIDLVVTSPPYADVVSYGKDVSCLSPEEYPKWFTELAKQICRVLKSSGSLILNINDFCCDKQRSIYVFETVCSIVKNTDLKLYDRYIWSKKAALPSGGDKRLNDRVEYIFHFVKDVDAVQMFPDEARVPYSESSLARIKYKRMFNDQVDDSGHTTNDGKICPMNPKGCIRSTVFDFNTASIGSRDEAAFHPAPFNEELPTYFIKWLTKRGDVVLDPFVGSGTTAVAAIKFRRHYIGFELNQAYKKEIDKRIAARKKDMESQFDFDEH